MDLKFYLALFFRRLHWFMLFVILGTAAGLSLATILPPTYAARAVLVVESEQIPDELAASTVQTQATEALQIIQQRILTRDRLIEMANRLGVYTVPNSPDRSRMTGDDVVRDLRDRIRIVTTGGGDVRSPQATIVTISFTAPTAALSAAVTNEIVTMMLQENVRIRTTVAGQTLDFFTDEVDRLDRELTARRANILAFQEANLNALPDSLDFRRSQQAAAQERLLSLERDAGGLRDRRERLVMLYEETGRVTAPDPATLTPEQRQLQSLQEELNAALVVMSPENPRVRMLQGQISALEERVAAQGGAAPTNGADPQFTAYQLQLADIDGQLDYIAQQKEQIGDQMAALQASIEATPGNAGALDTMQRDYANLRTQYDQAVANRARAETGDTIETLSKGQRISVIEQAVAPADPESPNRPLVAAAGIGGGIALGAGVVLLLELLNSAIRRPADLTSGLGITAFSTIPYIRTKWEMRRRRAIIVTLFLAVAIAVPGGLWLVHTQVMPLDLLLDRLVSRFRVT